MPEIPKTKITKAKEFNPVVVPDDVYKAEVTDLDTFDGRWGKTLVVTFKILEGENKGKEIDGMCSYEGAISKKNKVYKWAKLLVPDMTEEIGADFDPNKMMGKVGKILTAKKERVDNEGKKYFQSYVKELLE